MSLPATDLLGIYVPFVYALQTQFTVSEGRACVALNRPRRVPRLACPAGLLCEECYWASRSHSGGSE